MNNTNQPPSEQLAYAKIIYHLANVGIIAMIISYILYMTDCPQSFLPINRLVQLWDIRSVELIRITTMPVGLDLIHHLNRSDIISLMSIIFISCITILGYIRILPCFIKEKDLPYTLITLLQIIVLILAVFGIISFDSH